MSDGRMDEEENDEEGSDELGEHSSVVLIVSDPPEEIA